MKKILLIILVFVHLTACSQDNSTVTDIETSSDTKASIVSVSTSGSDNNYTFSVGISSEETGCAQYADWWEVISEEGTLLYRRILAHSHVTEQPFVRSGGTVNIVVDQVVIIRAHMNTNGYGTVAFKGSVANGFAQTTLASDFANGLAQQNPLPNGCAF